MNKRFRYFLNFTISILILIYVILAFLFPLYFVIIHIVGYVIMFSAYLFQLKKKNNVSLLYIILLLIFSHAWIFYMYIILRKLYTKYKFRKEGIEFILNYNEGYLEASIKEIISDMDEEKLILVIVRATNYSFAEEAISKIKSLDILEEFLKMKMKRNKLRLNIADRYRKLGGSEEVLYSSIKNNPEMNNAPIIKLIDNKSILKRLILYAKEKESEGYVYLDIIEQRLSE